ncbi:sulfite exporter TauE/SafE family protein [Oceanospirillum sp.]|uniref:sulfite exporter TauE/SafE family protein n=1 Tax=Oceanospirillum sp. TaxID=2021254 RepID=UPI003A8CE3B5
MIDDPLFYLVAIPAVLIVGISKGGMGGGLGMVAVPIMSLAIPPFQAAAIMLPILCVMDLIGLWGFRGKYDKTNLRILLPAAVLGILLGALSFSYLTEQHIKLMIGLIATLFTLNYAWQKLHRKPEKVTQADAVKGSFWGALAGFTSFSVHAGGPPMNIYMLPQKLDKTLFVGTTVIFFAVVNFTKLIPYAWLGLFDSANLMTSLALLIFAPIGVYFGMYLHKRVSDFWFYMACYGLLFVTGVKLISESLFSA